MSVYVIDLWPPTAECHVCGETTVCKWGVPVWNGSIVANDWPYEWGAVPACEACHSRHNRGEFVEVTTEEGRRIFGGNR